MKKKISIVLMILALSLNASTIFAADISPRAMTCDCGGNLNGKITTYDAWIAYGPTPCAIKKGYYDSKQKRTVHTTRICNRCGYKLTTDSTQYRVLCPH